MTVLDRDDPAVTLPETAVRVHVLRAAGVSVVVATRAEGLPEVLHWGRDVGEVAPDEADDLVLALARAVSPSAVDAAWPLTVLPTEHDGWEGRPAVAGQVAGRPLVPVWGAVVVEQGSQTLTIEARSDEVSLHSVLVLDDAGVLRVRHALTNTGTDDVEVDRKSVV